MIAEYIKLVKTDIIKFSAFEFSVYRYIDINTVSNNLMLEILYFLFPFFYVAA